MTNFALIILMAAALAVILAFIILVLLPAAKGDNGETIIFKGWVSRDKGDDELWFTSCKPIRDEHENVWQIAPEDEWWFTLPDARQYAIKWEDEPRVVEIVIRPRREEDVVFEEDLEADTI